MRRKTSRLTRALPLLIAIAFTDIWTTLSIADDITVVVVNPTCSLSFNGVGTIPDGLFSFNAPRLEGVEKYVGAANVRSIRFMFWLRHLGHADWMVPDKDLAIREDPKNPGHVDRAWWPKMGEAFKHSKALYGKLLPLGQHGLARHLKLSFGSPPPFLIQDGKMGFTKHPFGWQRADVARLAVGMIKAVETYVPGAHVDAIDLAYEPNLYAINAYKGGAKDPDAVKDYFDLLQPVADLVHKAYPGVMVDAPSPAGGLFFYGAWENFHYWVKPALARPSVVDRIDIHGYMERQEWLPLELTGSAFRFRTSLGLLRNYQLIKGIAPRPIAIGEHNLSLGGDPQAGAIPKLANGKLPRAGYFRDPIMQLYRAHFWLRELLTYVDEPDKLSLLSNHLGYYRSDFPFNMFDPDTKKPFPSFNVYRALADLRGQRVLAQSAAGKTLRIVSSVRSQESGKQLVLVLFNDDAIPRTVEVHLRGVGVAQFKHLFTRRLQLQPATGQVVYTEPSAPSLPQSVHLAPYETRSLRWDVVGKLVTSTCIDHNEYYGDKVLVPIEPGRPASFRVRVPAVENVRRLTAEVGIELTGKKQNVDKVLLPTVAVDGKRFVLPEPRFIRYPQSLNYPTQIDASRLDLLATSLPPGLVTRPAAHEVAVTLSRAVSGSYRVVFVRLAVELARSRRARAPSVGKTNMLRSFGRERR